MPARMIQKIQRLTSPIVHVLASLCLIAGFAGNAVAQTTTANSHGCPPQAGVKPGPSVETEIEAKDQAFVAAVLGRDTAALDALISPDFVYVHENGLISTKREFLQELVAKGYIEAVLQPLRPAEPMRQYCTPRSRCMPGTCEQGRIVLIRQRWSLISGPAKTVNGSWFIGTSAMRGNRLGNNSARPAGRIIQTNWGRRPVRPFRKSSRNARLPGSTL